MNFIVFVIRRLVWLMATLLGVSVLMFTLSQLVPADPARLALGLEATEEDVARMREIMGLDRPVHTQFFTYVMGLTRGDLGMSIRNQRPVMQDIKTYLPATIELTIVTIVMYVSLGVFLGIVAALNHGKVLDGALRLLSTIGVGMPSFWLALVLQAFLRHSKGSTRA